MVANAVIRSGFPETFCRAAALTIWMGAALSAAVMPV